MQKISPQTRSAEGNSAISEKKSHTQSAFRTAKNPEIDIEDMRKQL